ncbi:transcription factor TFIIE alpha subunit [Schizosaccharomyces japonicus yFS275]|uniref:Transcription factor TFIIE alpha subunit n=1 Tax=Schizosaccharomyces japonicus (strain yFS275 / FY16936) TaxID=402676 RepID=B6JXH7_SCHJY|nr:transcription factor TFIIE alpha subunit [Schizosaccharomyces japonicus yFS275]EEB05121.1 transcription factor TFIIE alpha subunit [Schizosaccharomyces japonicus yFS275]
MSNAPKSVIRLIKMIMRAFYETRHIIFVDAVLKHSCLTDEQMAMLMGIPVKECRNIAGKLREDRLLAIHNRTETKEGQQRQVHMPYYYINFCTTIDSIKWRMHQLVKTIEDRMRNDFDSKGYICPLCKRRYSSLDVLSLVTMAGTFACDDCGTELKDDEESVEMLSSQERLGRLMGQVNKIIDQLKQVDETVVPENSYTTAMEHAVPITTESSQNAEQQNMQKLESKTVQPQTSLTIDISAEVQKTDEEREKQRQRQAALAAQNALPEWHAMSTISGDITRVGAKHASIMPQVSDDLIDKKEDEIDISAEKDALDAYYASLRAKKTATAPSSTVQSTPTTVAFDNSDDETEFVSIPTTTTSHNDSSSTSVKREASVLVANDNKRIKTEEVEEPAKAVHIADAVLAADDDDDDDDDAEFEDV